MPSIANALTAAGAGACVSFGAACRGLLQQSGYSRRIQHHLQSRNARRLRPFGDMDANYSNGSSVYHGLSANLRKRFGSHYEFLASYTWSHAIDDSTDLQSTLTPQDSYYPSLDRSTSLFDQRHRFVFSGVYQIGQARRQRFRQQVLQRLDLRSPHRIRLWPAIQHHHRQRR